MSPAVWLERFSLASVGLLPEPRLGNEFPDVRNFTFDWAATNDGLRYVWRGGDQQLEVLAIAEGVVNVAAATSLAFSDSASVAASRETGTRSI